MSPWSAAEVADAFRDRSGQQLLHSTCPFSLKDATQHLPYGPANCVYLEVTANEVPLHSYLVRFVSKATTGAQSIKASMGKASNGLGDDYDDLGSFSKGIGKMMMGGKSSRKRKLEVKAPEPLIGLGWHCFDFEYQGTSIKVHTLYQHIGEPIGDPPKLFTSIVLFVEGRQQEPLLKLCQEATEAATKQKQNRVSLWRFDTRHQFWSRIARRLSRSLDSIVLEESVKKPLMDDVEWFVKEDTRAFYAKHGIPYHRCYLFHGEPGTGKTSLIYSLAGYLERNLCFVQMDKNMTDDTFRNAMSQLPPMAMVVLEDVDSLFTTHRESEQNSAALSFSGFLNCLDGLGAPDDVVICMTTNHPDKLDPAVMRPGRVDVKVAFKPLTKEVAARYFLTFYPGANEASTSFGSAMGDRISQRKVSMAQLQHFFLACNRLQYGAEQAAKHIEEFGFDDKLRSSAWSSAYM